MCPWTRGTVKQTGMVSFVYKQFMIKKAMGFPTLVLIKSLSQIVTVVIAVIIVNTYFASPLQFVVLFHMPYSHKVKLNLIWKEPMFLQFGDQEWSH
jgi:hypothetical protein